MKSDSASPSVAAMGLVATLFLAFHADAPIHAGEQVAQAEWFIETRLAFRPPARGERKAG
jgi:hypothetical protein